MDEKKGHCTRCERDYDQIRLHTAIAHSNKAERWCETCGRLFSKSSKHAAHVSEHTDKTMKCHVCCKTRFKDFSSFTKHLEKHDCLHIHTCQTCSKAFAFKWNYEQHVLSEHNAVNESVDSRSLDKEISVDEGIIDSSTTEDKGHCDVCSLDFDLISTHRALVHGDGTELLCTTCGRLFWTHDQYADHVARHRKTRHRCHVCKNKDFPDLTTFKRHLEEHDSLHVFPCTECSRTFALKKRLKKHHRKHESTTNIIPPTQTYESLNNSIENNSNLKTKNNSLKQSFNNKISKRLKSTNSNFNLKTTHYDDSVKKNKKSKKTTDGLYSNSKSTSEIQNDETSQSTKFKKNKNDQKVVIIDVSSEDDGINTVDRDKSKERGTVSIKKKKCKRNENKENSYLESIYDGYCVDKVKCEVESNSGDDVRRTKRSNGTSGVVMKNLDVSSVEIEGLDSVLKGGDFAPVNWSKVGKDECISDDERITDEGMKIGYLSWSRVHGRETIPHPLEEDVELSHDNDIVDRTCFKCGKVVSGGVSKHYVEAHGSSKPYCRECRKAFKNYGDFYFHMMRHADKYPWTCRTCGVKHKNKYHYKVHVRTVHNKKVSYSCSICGEEFIYFDNYDSHIRLHDDKLKFKCVHCRHPFIYKQYLPAHLTRKKCVPCSIRFPCIGLFKDHIRSVHFCEKIFSCPHCDDKYGFETSLKRHITFKHFDISAKSKSIVYCQHCSYFTHTLNNLYRHVKTHHTLTQPYASKTAVE